jgi:hypothetical protein
LVVLRRIVYGRLNEIIYELVLKLRQALQSKVIERLDLFVSCAADQKLLFKESISSFNASSIAGDRRSPRATLLTMDALILSFRATRA